MSKTYFITGISTEVGKTIVAAIVTEALGADYWKPIQAGELENSDTHTVKRLVSSPNITFHREAYALKTPMSPHAAAEIDGVTIDIKKIKRPKTKNSLVIEGAGGLLVPINTKNTMADLISEEDKTILISRHYLGSINHTLLSIELLKSRGLEIAGILFNGNENPSTESIIATQSGVNIIGRIDEEPYFDKNVVRDHAERFRESLKKL